MIPFKEEGFCSTEKAPDHESLSADRDWRVQSSKNEETLTLIECVTPDERVYRGYKIKKNPIGRQTKSVVRLHGLNNTKYCTGRIRFAALSIPQSALVQFRLCPKFTTPSVRQNLTTLHFRARQEKRTGRFACILGIRIGGLSLLALGRTKSSLSLYGFLMSDSYALAGVGFFLKPGWWSSSALCSTAYAAVKIDSDVFATSGGKAE
ncbi:hypothetical protein V6N11_073114 [Hibiscus sabdariffa]|uniref:Uncharacterized protein n=1 Tax=Hibiscus sabdariffa TaxID=183260 RepID=A0ABR2P9I2_9ROSI